MAQSGIDKAAILLATLGTEAAAGVFRHLSEHEVRQVSSAIARLRAIPRAAAAAVHEEAWRRLQHPEGVAVDGEAFARQLLTAGLSGARDVRRAEPGTLAAALEPVPPATLAQVLAAEHPQVVALVLANLHARKAAAVLAAFPEGTHADIVQRIADLQQVPEDVLADVEDVLHGQVDGLVRRAGGATFVGAKLAAEIMNVADPALEGRVFEQLDAYAPEVADTIRGLMFTFEDVVRLDDRSMQAVLKEVGRDELLLALKTASPRVRDKTFANMSRRAGDILQEDLSTMGPVRLKDVERAQASIVAAVRRLDAERKIAAGTGDDDVLV